MAESDGRGGEGDRHRKKRRRRMGIQASNIRGGEEPKAKDEMELATVAAGDGDGDGDGDGAGEEVRDPLVVLGPDVMTRVMELSDARSVARCLVVSTEWFEIAKSDRIWGPKCEKLWEGKAHIPRLSKVRGASRLTAYSMSFMDGKRTRIMKEDLCDHAWEFRFKKTAPEYWRNLDPSWKGIGPPMHRYFHPNGSQTADPNDEVWGGHECTFSIMTSYVGEGIIRDHYVRINRWPPMTVSRRPDWSWELSNHLYCYNTVPDPEKEGGTGPLFPVW